MINWRAVVVTVLLNAALINAAVIGFAVASARSKSEQSFEPPAHFACDHCPQSNPG
jgi:hypothetical protein